MQIPTHVKNLIRRLRLLVALFVFLGIAYGRYEFGNNDLDAVIAAVADATLISLLVYILSDLAISLTYLPEVKRPVDETLWPGTVASRSRANATTAEWWEYVGHTGRFTRSTIFPILERRATSRDIVIRIEVTIISPLNVELCRRFLEHQNAAQISYYSGKMANEDDIVEELLATIILCVYYKTRAKPFHISLFISDHFSVFRYDVCASEIIMSQGDPFEPAFVLKKENRLYSFLRKECEYTKRQSRSINISTSQIHSLENEAESLQALEELFSQAEFLKIRKHVNGALARARSNREPYAG